LENSRLKGWASKTRNPLRQEPAMAISPQLPRQRFCCVLGMLSSLEVKVLCPT